MREILGAFFILADYEIDMPDLKTQPVTNIFSAEEPTLGYLYQIKYSLLLLIKSSDTENAQIAIEKLDDIELIKSDETLLSQLKYHLNSVANLTDRSSDLWKTLRIWSTGIVDGSIDIESTSCHLITTAPVSTDMIAKELTKPLIERDIDDICTKLTTIAAETTNATNKPGYDAFNVLSNELKKKLIARTFIFESSMDISEVDKSIHSELRKTIIDDKVPTLTQYLTGWYLEKTIFCLLKKADYITFLEYQQKCFEIIEMLKKDNLPADFLDPILLSQEEMENYQDRIFVKQLRIIGIGGKGLQFAVSDYYRAYEQRSNWVRKQLISGQEEVDYERKLVDDWTRKFDGLMETDESTTIEHKKEMGKTFYNTHYVSSYPRIFIREKFDHIYLITGSCQILSDDKKIGWHPDFQGLV